MKKYYVLTLFLSFFILINTVKCEELEIVKETMTYDNYYYFIEAYGVDVYDVGDDYTVETVNQTIFPAPDFGGDFSIGNMEIIELRRTNSTKEDSNTIKSFATYYNGSNNVANNGLLKSYEFIDDKYCLAYYSESKNGTNVVRNYIHGCYRGCGGKNCSEDLENGNWKDIYNKDQNGFYEMNNNEKMYFARPSQSSMQMACASVYRTSNVNVDKIVQTENSGKYMVVTVTRNAKPSSEVTIGSNIGANQDASSQNFAGCSEEAENTDYVNKLNGKMYSPVLAKYTYTKTNYSCKEKESNPISECNNSSVINQSCGRMTISGDSSKADISINQTGNIVNLLSPTSIYQGGGINLGFVYYNTISWDIVEGTLKHLDDVLVEESIDQISSLLRQKIKTASEIENDLNIEILIDNVSYLSDINNNLVKKCQQLGEVKPGETLTTICTVFLPVTKLEAYTGKISGISNIYGDGINNKYYTDLTFNGKLNISATVSGLNLLKKGGKWTVKINPNKNDASCQVDVYNRLYTKTNSGKANKFAFIYRPVDINNPFPGRNAGVNWYSWYQGANVDKLRESYNNLEYQANLDPYAISEIKKYNSGKNYLEWYGIDEYGNSEFIRDAYKDYFTKVGGNS